MKLRALIEFVDNKGNVHYKKYESMDVSKNAIQFYESVAPRESPTFIVESLFDKIRKLVSLPNRKRKVVSDEIIRSGSTKLTENEDDLGLNLLEHIDNLDARSSSPPMPPPYKLNK
jgi:hypothetical protein